MRLCEPVFCIFPLARLTLDNSTIWQENTPSNKNLKLWGLFISGYFAQSICSVIHSERILPGGSNTMLKMKVKPG